jgi:hypothetical protein
MVVLVSTAAGAKKPAKRSKTDEVMVSVSKGPLQMRIQGPIVLGRNNSAKITLRRPEGHPSPVLLVNTGNISQPVESKGLLIATYTPPKQLFPQVAIIAAVSKDGWLLDWVAVPLYGETVVHTATEARAKVVVRIADRKFGPVKANRRGRARIGIVAPPGVTTGTTISRDRLGNVKKTTFKLDVPKFNRMLGICPSTSDRFLVLSVDSKGKPKQGESLDLKSSRGTLDVPTILAPGVYESVLSLPPDVRIGEKVKLSAESAKDETSHSMCTLKLRRGLPATVKLHANPTVYVAGSGTPVLLTAEFLDADGKPALPVPLAAAADIGRVSEFHAAPDGSHQASWTLPDNFAGKEKAKLSARTRTKVVIPVELFVELKPGPLSGLEVSVGQKQLQADGNSTTAVIAKGHDAGGNLVPTVELVARAQGQIGAFAPGNVEGEYQATYTAPQSHKELEDKIVISSSAAREVKATVGIHLLPDSIEMTLAPRVGFATNFGRIWSALFAVQFDVRLPVMKKRLSVGVEAMFYWSDRTERLTNWRSDARVAVWATPLLVRGAYTIPLGSWSLVTGLAGGALIVNRQISSPTDAPIETIEVHPAISGHLGTEVGIGLGYLTFELAYMHVFSTGGPVEADLSVPLVTAGYRFEF